MRLFFALWPEYATCIALDALSCALHEQCGGRRVAARRVHLTLVFLGDVRSEVVPALQEMAGTVRGGAIKFELNVAEYWRHNRIVCAGTSHCPQTLLDLQARLSAGAQALGVRTEARDYVPHITLLRRAERAPARRELSGVTWRASWFVLVRSVLRRDAAAYETIARWPLADPAHSP